MRYRRDQSAIFIVNVKSELVGKLYAGDMVIRGQVKKSVNVGEIVIDKLLEDIKLPTNYAQLLSIIKVENTKVN